MFLGGGEMYKTYSYNDMPTPVRRYRDEKPRPNPKPSPPAPPPKEKKEEKKEGILGGLFDNFETDDIILVIVVLALLMDDCDDKLLLIALAFIFFSEWF